jgi:hypothetical protein
MPQAAAYRGPVAGDVTPGTPEMRQKTTNRVRLSSEGGLTYPIILGAGKTQILDWRSSF